MKIWYNIKINSMIQKSLKQLGILALMLSALVLPSSSAVFGQQTAPKIPLSEEAEIFPFASGSEDPTAPIATPAPSSATEPYSEQLYEVTDEGIKDPNGNLLLPALPEGSATPTPALPGASESQTAFEEYQASIISNWGGKKAYTEKRLEDIKQSLIEEQATFDKLNKKVKSLTKALEPIQREKQTLNGEIDLLNSQITESKNKIKSVEYQIAETQISLKGLIYNLRQSEAELNVQRDVALDYILMVYREDEKFRDYFNNGSSTFKLLLADSSVGESLLGQEYSNIMEKTGREVFYSLHQKKLALDEKRQSVQEKQASLEDLNQSLNEERRIMEENRQTKKDLLEQTQGKEEQYQQLLEESLKQQLESAIQIQNMKENIEFIDEKLKLLDESLAQAQQLTDAEAKIEDLKEVENVVNGIDQTANGEENPIEGTQSDTPARRAFFNWPVPPVAITAYFHDETYPKRWGIHQAIDIRAKQFTEIHAPANAYVFQAKDNGIGYSYIILAHKNKLITVYGHVTEFRVKAGDVVKEGDVIGLTGGTPGTKGAGWQTTGPHLHFEVWHDGAQVDPLDWLPVEMLPLENIPDRFLTQLAPIAVPLSK